MAFDQSTRNRLSRFVGDARELLTSELTRQCQDEYGLDPATGDVAELGTLARLDDAKRETARLLRDTLAHYLAATPGPGTTAHKEALVRIVREQAFTILNRLCALRLAEARGLLVESVAKGYTSTGFRLYAQLAGPGLGETGDAYAAYLFSVFDEFAVDLPVLFDRFSPSGRLFPRETVLLALLAAINDAELEPLWAEDETIGWIYQYFNSKDERKAMRDASAAPRNSRELAVRNQFFTPRYVVEFLTDNTLGRIWYEMTRGQTGLKEQCRYLVRRPTEIFLAPGETAPEAPAPATTVMPAKAGIQGPAHNDGAATVGNDLSQEELLRQPVYIPHRALKDPREILMLDPACGSMHFGLYAFDLFERIYEEAWEMQSDDRWQGASGRRLIDDYPTKEALLRDVPRLILERNIHGIDIDPRAVQIAGLSLWLRAQRSWHAQELTPAQRPAITRSNVVCAEPMPGETAFLEDFLTTTLSSSPEDRLLGQIVGRAFEAMMLAGEAGSLLKIEEEIGGAVAEAKQKWQAHEDARQPKLFEIKAAPPTQESLGLDTSGITNEAFWDIAEAEIYKALRKYAETATTGNYQRRLFTDDVTRGFAFIDICRKRYDVALMNPPFGDASLPSKPYLDDTYGDTKGDVYKAFVECFQTRIIPAGYLGIISSRTGFFLGQSEDWRTRIVLRLFRPIVLADLGGDVLDAMVEVATYVLRNLSEQEARDLTLSLVPVLRKVERDGQDRFSLPKWQIARGGLKRHQAAAELKHLESEGYLQRSPGDAIRYAPLWHALDLVTSPSAPTYPPLVCIRAESAIDKGAELESAVRGFAVNNLFVCDPGTFADVPGSPFAYWIGSRIHRLFSQFPAYGVGRRDARHGPATSDDFKLLRGWWEVEPEDISRVRRWVPYAKGGSAVRYYLDQPLVVAWEERRFTFLGFFGRPGRWQVRLESSDCFFRPGITWPLRAAKFTPQILPAGCVFSARGYAAFSEEESLLSLMGLMASSGFDFLFKLLLGRFGFPEFVVGALQQLPIPPLNTDTGIQIAELAFEGWTSQRSLDSIVEHSHAFLRPALIGANGIGLVDRITKWGDHVDATVRMLETIQSRIDALAIRIYGLELADRVSLTSIAGAESDLGALSDTEVDDDESESSRPDATRLTGDLLGYAVGCIFGRWDIRFATGERLAPELPDPFAPLPVCPPGMLQNAAGLPAAPADMPADYPLRITWGGILPDDAGHPDDIERRVRDALRVICAERADAIEQEACEILGVKTLREYFRKPGLFFADHLKRYSKSRRQAPIYWPLSTPSGSYTLWLYYHRLSDQTLYTCVNDFVEPRLKAVAEQAAGLARKSGRSGKDEEELEQLTTLEAELKDFRAELLRVAAFWKPNLNDGVQITAAPLWRLFQFKPWQKKLKETWAALEAGDYDWAHLAYSIRPNQVREKCKSDKSLAIAHDLEAVYIEPPAPAKKKAGRKKKVETETEALLDEDEG